MKIMTTSCPDHLNCTLRVTAGDGEETIEHVRTLTTIEADALSARLVALEEDRKRIAALEDFVVSFASVVAGVKSESESLREEFANVSTVKLSARVDDVQDRVARPTGHGGSSKSRTAQ